MSVLRILLLVLTATASGEELVSFGVTTSDKSSSQSGGHHTLTVWFNQDVYQCTIIPNQQSTTYTCDSSAWTFEGCDFNSESDGAKMLIDNTNSADAPIFDDIFITTTGDGTADVTYRVQGYCVIDSAVTTPIIGLHQRSNLQDGEALCEEGFTHFSNICIDNEVVTSGGGCPPARQLLYFDTSQPGVTLDNAEWEDASHVTIDTTTGTECVEEELVSFGVTTTANPSAGTVTLTVWFNQNVYQCSVGPSSGLTTYSCDSSTWTLEGCDPTSDSKGAKILLDNANSHDAPVFSNIFITTTGDGTADVTYGIQGFCASESAVNTPIIGLYQRNSLQDGQNTLCEDGIHFSSICVDNEGVTASAGCPPGRQVLYFDTTQPDVSIDNADWADATSFTIETSETCVLSDNCEDIGSFVWEDLMNSGTGIPETAHSLSIDDASLTLSIDIEADYLGYSGADNNGYVYGTAYVIDFDDFNAHRDSIKQPGNCQNRADVFGDPGLPWHDVWAYSTTPNNDGQVGTTAYLAYPPGNKWDVAMSSDDLCKVTYSASFTWDDLTRCTGYNGANGLYINTKDNEANITLSGTIYLNVVSPIDFGADYGFYRVYQLLSQPFMIVVSKTVYVLSDVGINLLTMHIIAVFKEDDGSTFELVVLTESAEYLRLSREGEGTEYLQVFAASDVDNEIESSNFATLEAAETGTDCLGNKDYICTQLWQITASDVQCTTDGIFTDFSGTYSIQFNAVCRDVADLGGDQELVDYCEDWLTEHEDEIITDDKVLLQADLTWKDEICDPEIFEVQFEAEMEFYYDSFGTELPDAGHLFQVGEDTVYVKISTAYPSDHYDVFTTDLVGVWICTFDPLTDYDTDIAFEVDSQVGGCFSDARDSNDFTYHIFDSSDGTTAEDFVLDETTTTLESNEIQFQFDVPDKVQRDTLYIHAQIEISLVGDEGRRRVLLWTNVYAMTNQMEHFVDRIPVGSSPQPKPVPQSPVHHPKYPLEGPTAPVQQPWVISLQSPWVMAIGALLAVVLCVNIVLMCYTNCVEPNRAVRYSLVKATTDTDSEFDAASEERDAINVDPEL
eukprot:1015917_1